MFIFLIKSKFSGFFEAPDGVFLFFSLLEMIGCLSTTFGSIKIFDIVNYKFTKKDETVIKCGIIVKTRVKSSTGTTRIRT